MQALRDFLTDERHKSDDFDDSSTTPPLTPLARFRRSAVQTGRRDSGYGTDNVPSPASVTSARSFSFTESQTVHTDDEISEMSADFINMGISAESDDDSQCEDVFLKYALEEDSSKYDDGDDQADNEVANISNNNCCSEGSNLVFDPVTFRRPQAPVPCVVGDTPSCPESPLNSGNETTDKPCTFVCTCPRARNYRHNVSSPQTPHSLPVNPVTFTVADCDNDDDETGCMVPSDRSMSLPDVLEPDHHWLREQEVGRRLRRLSDEFYAYHCLRRRGRHFSLHSPTFPLSVDIDVYTNARVSRGDQELADEFTAETIPNQTEMSE